MTNILNNMSFQELLNQMVLTHKFYLEHQISITNANSNYNFFQRFEWRRRTQKKLENKISAGNCGWFFHLLRFAIPPTGAETLLSQDVLRFLNVFHRDRFKPSYKLNIWLDLYEEFFFDIATEQKLEGQKLPVFSFSN